MITSWANPGGNPPTSDSLVLALQIQRLSQVCGFLFVLFFKNRVPLCSPGWSRICCVYVGQSHLKGRDLPACVSLVLGLQVFASTPGGFCVRMWVSAYLLVHLRTHARVYRDKCQPWVLFLKSCAASTVSQLFPGTCSSLIRLAGMELSDLRVSASPGLRQQVRVASVGFVCGYWGSNSLSRARGRHYINRAISAAYLIYIVKSFLVQWRAVPGRAEERVDRMQKSGAWTAALTCKGHRFGSSLQDHLLD